MKKLYELKENLCEKLEDYNGKEVTTSTLEIMESLSNTIKNIGKIIAMSEEEYSDYSGRRSYNMSNHYAYEDSDGSFARGRGRNARRDSMGRYSRDDYSRDMADEMREMARDLPENKRRDMERLIQKMENM